MSQFRDFLITDRTTEDIDRANYLSSLWVPGGFWIGTREYWTGTDEEWEEWEAGPKGLYNAKDLNRVTLAASYLLTKLEENGFDVPPDAFPAYMVSVSVDPPGSGKAYGALYYAGDEATVKAEPLRDSVFSRWEKNGEVVSETPVYTFSPGNADVELTAVFEADLLAETSIVGSGRIGKAILGRSEI